MTDIKTKEIVSEFLGTYLLVVTVGCNIIGDNKEHATMSIAAVLMVMVYCLGAVSGAHFNPAVSFAVMINGSISPLKCAAYCITQVLAGLSGGGSYYLLYG